MSSQQPEATTCPSCGKRLRWRAELVGRKVKCQCGEAFRMPETPQPAAPPPPADKDPFELEESPRTSRAAESADESPLLSALNDLDLNHASQPALATCPSCGAPMKAEAVLCVGCGYNRKSGKKLQTAATVAASTSALGGDEDEAAEQEDDSVSEDSRPATTPRRRRTTGDETNFKIMDVYVPIAMIVVGIIFTVLRSYGGMGLLGSDEEEEDAAPQKITMFGRSVTIEADPSEVPKSELEETYIDQDTIVGNPEAERLLEILKATPPSPPPPVGPEKVDDKDKSKDKATPESAPPAPEPALSPAEAEAQKTAQKAAVKAKRKLVATRSSQALALIKEKKGLTISPLILAFYSLMFQAIVMVPIILLCCILAAKLVDISFGSLQTTVLKIAGLVLGPMAICDWISDALLSATLGTGWLLAWVIRVSIVGVSLSKLFDLNFYEMSMLLLVILVVQIVLAMVLILTVSSFFIM